MIAEPTLVVGVDASRNRSGGAKAHLLGVLGEGDPARHGIREVHVWAYRSLADSLPRRPWLVVHTPAALEGSLLAQVWWQRRHFPAEARAAGCDVVLNTDAGSVSRFHPSVTMSRDMLSYEPGEAERYGWSRARLRLIALRYVQNASLKSADGAVFLTHHAARVIQEAAGPMRRVEIIPHGVGAEFKATKPAHEWPSAGERPIRLLYVSNAAPYKHPWNVVEAVAAVRARGHDVVLDLVGGGSGPAQRRLDETIRRADPRGAFVRQAGFVPPRDLPRTLADADLFVFASSCENMPNTLVEAMAVGLPIACSKRGPMPEVLREGGLYFDPEDVGSIAAAIERLLTDPEVRRAVAGRARSLADAYGWGRCADETWAFVRRVAMDWRGAQSAGGEG